MGRQRTRGTSSAGQSAARQMCINTSPRVLELNTEPTALRDLHSLSKWHGWCLHPLDVQSLVPAALHGPGVL